METYSLYNKELLHGDFHPQIVAYYFREWNNFKMDFHSHNRVEIMYVIRGVCMVETDKEALSMKRGDFILLDANTPHNLMVEKDKPCRMLNIEFIFHPEKSCYPSIREMAQSDTDLSELLTFGSPYILLKDNDEIYYILRSLIAELDGINRHNRNLTQLLISQLLLRISRLTNESKGVNAGTGSCYVEKALQYIQHHYDYDIDTKNIASAVNVHPGYLHRIFKANTGCTILEYLTNLRMDKAKMLLSHTEIPIIDVTNYIGINSRQYFTYLFKKHTGMTPAEYRKSIDTFIGFNES